MGSIERFQGPTEIAADKGNLGGDAAGASDRFSRAKGGGPQQQPRSAEIAKLGHGNAAQRHCRRVIAQRDTVQRAEGITRARSRAPALIGESHSNPDTLVTPSRALVANISTSRSTPRSSRAIRQ